MMRTHFFGENAFYAHAYLRGNPNIETPPDEKPFPIPPDQEHSPPVDEPPNKRDTPDGQPDPPPMREPGREEPVRLI